MTYQRFEDVPVWQEAIRLGQLIYAFTRQPPFKGQYSLRDQIERAAVSVSNNIAEGFERGTTPELITFLYYARGSAGEVRSMLCLMEGIPAFANFKSEISISNPPPNPVPGNCVPGPTRCKTARSKDSAI